MAGEEGWKMTDRTIDEDTLKEILAEMWEVEKRLDRLHRKFVLAVDLREEKWGVKNDEAVDDKGNNFGRIARTGIMDSYTKQIRDIELLGIKADQWIAFFKNAKG